MQTESKLLMEPVNIISNPSHSITNWDGNIHHQENSDVHYEMFDAITMDANPSYGRARTTAHGITAVPMSDVVIQPNPSYSSYEDECCYVKSSEIKYHRTVHNKRCTSYLKLISPNATDDSVNEMTTQD